MEDASIESQLRVPLLEVRGRAYGGQTQSERDIHPHFLGEVKGNRKSSISVHVNHLTPRPHPFTSRHPRRRRRRRPGLPQQSSAPDSSSLSPYPSSSSSTFSSYSSSSSSYPTSRHQSRQSKSARMARNPGYNAPPATRRHQPSFNQSSQVIAPWKLWDSLAITVKNLTEEINAFILWSAFQEHGNIYSIDIFEDAQGNRESKGRIRFK